MSEREYPPIGERLDREDLRARKHDRARFQELDRTPIVLILDGVFGSYNQGAIFRLADAFLIEKVHFCGASVIAGHRRFLKAARGTHPWVPYSAEEEATEVVQRYADQGYQVVAVEQCEGSISVLDLNDQLRAPLCLVLGGELSGVSPELLPLTELVVELPTLGMANSLNVAMSAGMLVLSAYRSIKSKV